MEESLTVRPSASSRPTPAVRRVWISAVALVGLTLLLFPTDAFAYIDPGTGSMAYQMLLVLVLGAGLVFRRACMRVGAFVFGLFHRGPTPPAGTPPAGTPPPPEHGRP